MAAGSELKRARERSGLSVEQVSEKTKLNIQKVLALEEGDYSRLPDGIYLSGIVRAYAREVGIDAEPMLEQIRLERRELLGPSDSSSIAAADIPKLRGRQTGPYMWDESRERPRPGRVAPWLLPLLVMLAGAAVGMSAMYVAKLLYGRATSVEQSADITARSNTPMSEAARVAPREASLEPSRTFPNVTGSWNLSTYVESSSYSPFEGLELGYDLTLKQDGDSVIGSGRKVTENGKRLARGAQTAIALSGTIDRDLLTLSFVERGSRRRTEGTLVLNVDARGMLTGRFSSGAAESAGRAQASPIVTR